MEMMLGLKSVRFTNQYHNQIQTYRSLATNLAKLANLAVAKYWMSAFRHDTSSLSTTWSLSCAWRKESNEAASSDSSAVKEDWRGDDSDDDEFVEISLVVFIFVRSCLLIVLTVILPSTEWLSSSPERDRLHPALDLGLKKEVIIVID